MPEFVELMIRLEQMRALLEGIRGWLTEEYPSVSREHLIAQVDEALLMLDDVEEDQ